MHGAGDVRIEDVPDAQLREPTDALVPSRAPRSAAATSGPTSRWSRARPVARMGHEFIGVVAAVGDDVRTVKTGRPRRRAVPLVGRHLRLLPRGPAHVVPARRQIRRPTASTAARERRCACRRRTARSSCCPSSEDDALMPSLLTLSDVMSTGHHAARSAHVGPGKTVAVVGDGAVGLCGVIASRRLGAERSSSSAVTPTGSRSRVSSARPTSSASAATRRSNACAS